MIPPVIVDNPTFNMNNDIDLSSIDNKTWGKKFLILLHVQSNTLYITYLSTNQFIKHMEDYYIL
jgi:hypothetical protein